MNGLKLNRDKTEKRATRSMDSIKKNINESNNQESKIVVIAIVFIVVITFIALKNIGV